MISSTDEFNLSPATPPTAFADFKQVSETEVHKIIMNSPTKSCLLDPWPTFLIKECLDILLPSITKLVNCSLAEGVVPKVFKNAIVTPLLKKTTLSQDEKLSASVWSELLVKACGACCR